MRLSWDFTAGLGGDAAESRRGADIIPLSGYLWKMKRSQKMVTPAWNKRWFTIDNDALNWYKSKSSETPSGQIPLLSITKVAKFEKGQTGANSFIIKAKSRSLLLRAATPGEVNKWVGGVNLQIDLRKGGTIQGPPCKKNQRKVKKTGNNFDVMLASVQRTLEELEGMKAKAVATPDDATRSLATATPEMESPTGSSSEEQAKEDAPAKPGVRVNREAFSEQAPEPKEQLSQASRSLPPSGEARGRESDRKEAGFSPVIMGDTETDEVEYNLEPARQRRPSRLRNLSDSFHMRNEEDRLFSQRESPGRRRARRNLATEVIDLSEPEEEFDDGHWGRALSSGRGSPGGAARSRRPDQEASYYRRPRVPEVDDDQDFRRQASYRSRHNSHASGYSPSHSGRRHYEDGWSHSNSTQSPTHSNEMSGSFDDYSEDPYAERFVGRPSYHRDHEYGRGYRRHNRARRAPAYHRHNPRDDGYGWHEPPDNIPRARTHRPPPPRGAPPSAATTVPARRKGGKGNHNEHIVAHSTVTSTVVDDIKFCDMEDSMGSNAGHTTVYKGAPSGSRKHLSPRRAHRAWDNEP
mmetsp:Transcript_6424/g.18116  ORF Transcript_6424/g.18116 Transcript_6424/m.18116 type:complete len:578 (-) Transcript_6424:1704-3437(-)